jgi:hypothetical protein
VPGSWNELLQPMNFWRNLAIGGLALVLSASAAKLSVQATATNAEDLCFAVRVHINGSLVDGPKTINFKTKGNEEAASLEGSCFRVPAAILREKTVDVFFTLPKDKVYLSSISTGFLAGPWDVELKDKHFGSGWPKHARNKESCGVVFHVGEPERGVFQTPYRTPLPPKPGR